jgi:hypothetical protein
MSAGCEGLKWRAIDRAEVERARVARQMGDCVEIDAPVHRDAP